MPVLGSGDGGDARARPAATTVPGLDLEGLLQVVDEGDAAGASAELRRTRDEALQQATCKAMLVALLRRGKEQVLAPVPGDVVGDAARIILADCLVLLARIIELEINRRNGNQKPNQKVFACCCAALALDPGNERGKVRLGWELYHRRSYGQVRELGNELPATSSHTDAMAEVVAAAESKRSAWIAANVSPKDIDVVAANGVNSPVKSLKGIGKKAALSVSPNGQEDVVIADAIIPAASGPGVGGSGKVVQRVEECRRVLWPGDGPAARTRLSPEHALELEALLTPADGRFKIMSWNAMASLPTHGVTAAMLDTKTRNLAAAALQQREPHVSVFCVQECPGNFIGTRGTAAAKATRQPGSTFGARLLHHLNLHGTFDGRDIDSDGTTTTADGDTVSCGESHAVAWDSSVWMLDPDNPPRPLKYPGLRRAVVLTVLVLREAEKTTRLALLSCHLKSGGGGGTKADIQCLTDVAVPEVMTALAVTPRPGDALLVCGDFNLAPTDATFDPLRGRGFRNVGDPDGNSTNQSEFTVSGDLHVYDSAWLWQRSVAALPSPQAGPATTGTERPFSTGMVMEIPDVAALAEDRAVLMALLKAACNDWTPSSGLGAALKAKITGAGDTDSFAEGPVGRAVINTFKQKVNQDWSDHKPICLDLALW